MFDGEAASLQALLQTNTVHVPKPIKVHTSIMSLGSWHGRGVRNERNLVHFPQKSMEIN